jgi:hypothetical protein
VPLGAAHGSPSLYHRLQILQAFGLRDPESDITESR